MLVPPYIIHTTFLLDGHLNWGNRAIDFSNKNLTIENKNLMRNILNICYTPTSGSDLEGTFKTTADYTSQHPPAILFKREWSMKKAYKYYLTAKKSGK